MTTSRAFPKGARLLKAHEFTAVLRKPDYNVSLGPTRFRAKLSSGDRPRLGVVVSKRGNAKAVRRNRLKRILREQFRTNAHALPAVDIVIQVFGKLDDSRLVKVTELGFQGLTQHYEHASE